MWLVCAALFVVWMVVPAIDDELVRAEIGYAGAAALLCALLRGAVPAVAVAGVRRSAANCLTEGRVSGACPGRGA